MTDFLYLVDYESFPSDQNSNLLGFDLFWKDLLLAHGASSLLHEPFLDAIDMEVVFAGQFEHFFLFFPLFYVVVADRADLIYVLGLDLFDFGELLLGNPF